MSNAFKRAAEKQKTSPGGLPEEMTAGKEKNTEVITTEVLVEEPVVEKEEPVVVQEKVKAEEVKEEATEPVKPKNSLAASYQERKTEPDTRTSRLSVFITHSISEKLNEHVKARKIKSKNDLVNFLLEQYFEGEN